MRVSTCISLTLVVLAGAGARTASAQGAAAQSGSQKPARAEHVRISVNAGVQPFSIAFTSSTAKAVNLENAVVNTGYGVGRGPSFDGGVLFRVAGGLHVGVAVSTFMKRQDGAVAATIPHPFFYNTPRPIAGAAGSLQRNEFVTHMDVAYVIAHGKRVDIALSGGPSWFRVKQDLVTGLTYTESYPYDTVALAAASSTSVSVTKIGYNAGADVGVRVSKGVGVGGLVRFSRASVEFPLAGATTNVKSDAGGVLVAGGLRLFF